MGIKTFAALVAADLLAVANVKLAEKDMEAANKEWRAAVDIVKSVKHPSPEQLELRHLAWLIRNEARENLEKRRQEFKEAKQALRQAKANNQKHMSICANGSLLRH